MLSMIRLIMPKSGAEDQQANVINVIFAFRFQEQRTTRILNGSRRLYLRVDATRCHYLGGFRSANVLISANKASARPQQNGSRFFPD